MDFKIVWSDAAIADIENICSYIASDDPQAAIRLGRGILEHVRVLASFPFYWPHLSTQCEGSTARNRLSLASNFLRRQ